MIRSAAPSGVNTAMISNRKKYKAVRAARDFAEREVPDIVSRRSTKEQYIRNY